MATRKKDEEEKKLKAQRDQGFSGGASGGRGDSGQWPESSSLTRPTPGEEYVAAQAGRLRAGLREVERPVRAFFGGLRGEGYQNVSKRERERIYDQQIRSEEALRGARDRFHYGESSTSVTDVPDSPASRPGTDVPDSQAPTTASGTGAGEPQKIGLAKFAERAIALGPEKLMELRQQYMDKGRGDEWEKLVEYINSDDKLLGQMQEMRDQYRAGQPTPRRDTGIRAGFTGGQVLDMADRGGTPDPFRASESREGDPSDLEMYDYRPRGEATGPARGFDSPEHQQAFNESMPRGHDMEMEKREAHQASLDRYREEAQARRQEAPQTPATYREELARRQEMAQAREEREAGRATQAAERDQANKDREYQLNVEKHIERSNLDRNKFQQDVMKNYADLVGADKEKRVGLITSFYDDPSHMAAALLDEKLITNNEFTVMTGLVDEVAEHQEVLAQGGKLNKEQERDYRAKKARLEKKIADFIGKVPKDLL